MSYVWAYNLNTGHISLYGATQYLKHGHLPNKDFDPIQERFNVLYNFLDAVAT